MPKTQTKQTLALYLRATKPYRLLVTGAITAAAIAVLTGTVGYYYIISEIIALLSQYNGAAADAARLSQLFGIALLLSATEFVCWRISGLLVVKQQSSTLRDLERKIFRKLIAHSYRFFVSRFGGAIVTQFSRFLKGYEMLEDAIVFDVGSAALRLVSYMVILTILAPFIGISLLVWVIIFIVSVGWMISKKIPLSKRAAAADSAVTADIADAVTNILNVKIFGRDQFETQRFAETTGRRLEARRRSWIADELIYGYQSFLLIGFDLFIIYLSIQLVTAGRIEVSTVLLAQFYIARISADLWSISRTSRRIERALSDSAEMTEILNLPEEVQDDADAVPVAIKQGAIHFDHVTFRYESENPAVFKDFNLQIAPGEKVGLAGHSGSGKSTLTKLLLRFADIESGTIFLDGHDISKLPQADLRAVIAYVPQEPILFHRSLLDNIRYGRLDATDQEVRDAAKLAHAAEFIDDLPGGYDTLVGERGVKLSGGEKQRVAIARAMLSRAPVLLLDEATSALDSRSEKLIAEALQRLMKGRTTLVIAHRLSTIRRLDRIIVMHKGKIVEAGPHDKLLAQGGRYHELWSHQTGDFMSSD